MEKYTVTYNYDKIPNPHVKVVGNKTFIVEYSLIRHSSSFTSNKKKNMYGKFDITLHKNHFLLISIDICLQLKEFFF
jgi:hypothetical protein